MNQLSSITTPTPAPSVEVQTLRTIGPFHPFSYPSSKGEKCRRESIITMSRLPNCHSYARHPMSAFPHSEHLQRSPQMNIRPHAEQQFTSAEL